MYTQGMSDVTPEELAERLSILTLREFTPPEMISTVHTGWRFLVTPPGANASAPATRAQDPMSHLYWACVRALSKYQSTVKPWSP